jgi:serine protease Do
MVRVKMIAGAGKILVFTVALGVAFAAPYASRAQAPVQPVASPKGWFGVMITDSALMNENGATFFERYPVVSRVEEGSPAAKAGVRPGDVLMTFNSRDMRGGALELSNWLKPGAPFELRLRRNDQVRIVRGTLERRPDNWQQVVTVEISPAEQKIMRTGGEMPASGMQRTGYRIARSPAPARLPSVLVPALGFGGGLYPFAGAEFTALSDDLSEVLGVKAEGVFVTNVIEGSLARTAGLRGGDVVLMADTIKCESPNDLVRAIRNADDGSVRLQIIRKRKPQIITLRWAVPRD